MKLVDLEVDRILHSANSRSQVIIILKQDKDAFFGLSARSGVYETGQNVPVLMSSDGESISWPPKR